MHKIHKNLASVLLTVFTAIAMQWSLVALAETPKPIPTPADAQPLEEVPPPPALGAESNPDEPQITIVKRKGETIEEYRVNGQLYMMKVTPAHGVPYYLHKEDQEGSWVNIGPNPPLSIPKWTIFRF